MYIELSEQMIGFRLEKQLNGLQYGAGLLIVKVEFFALEKLQNSVQGSTYHFEFSVELRLPRMLVYNSSTDKWGH